jgi:peptidoglycan/LPS O-acetylase OafA/YrhL
MSVRPVSGAPWTPKYELLDGLRGLAALAVVLHHIGVADVGHFSVMVFFVISGYCITASAESCRRNGGGFRDFMLRRVKRIYPPYLLAIAYFAFTRAIRVMADPSNDFRRPVLDWVQNLTLTQWVSDLFHPVHWPAQNPKLFVAAFWSLNYEEQFYLVMGIGLLAAIRLGVPMVIPGLFLGAVGLVAGIATCTLYRSAQYRGWPAHFLP